MGSLETFLMFGLGGYFLALIIIGFLPFKNNSSGYVIAGRNLGLLGFVSSMGANFRDVAFSWFWIMLAYQYGWWPILIMTGYVFANLIIAKYAPFLRQLSKEKDYITAIEWVSESVGSLTANSSKYISLFVSVIFSAGQIAILGGILSSLTEWNANHVILIISFVIGFYVLSGGFINVIRTDIFQAFIIFAMFIIVYLYNPVENLGLSNENYPPMDWGFLVSLTFPLIIGAFVAPDLWQRVFASKNDNVASLGPILGAVYSTILTMGLIIIGIIARSLLGPDTDPTNILSEYVMDQMLSPIAGAAILVGLFSMGMSTLDTQAYNFSSIITRDVFKISPSIDHEGYKKRTRICTVLFMVTIAILAMFLDNFVNTLMGLFSFYSVVGVVYVVAIINSVNGYDTSHKLDIYVTITLMVSFLVFLPLFIFEMFVVNHFYMLLSPVIAVIGCFLSLLYSRRNKNHK